VGGLVGARAFTTAKPPGVAVPGSMAGAVTGGIAPDDQAVVGLALSLAGVGAVRGAALGVDGRTAPVAEGLAMGAAAPWGAVGAG